MTFSKQKIKPDLETTINETVAKCVTNM